MNKISLKNYMVTITRMLFAGAAASGSRAFSRPDRRKAGSVQWRYRRVWPGLQQVRPRPVRLRRER